MPPAQGKRILVVDDEPEVGAALAALLALDGHEADLATDGRQALERLDATREYDVILTDLKMPHLDGPGLYRAIARSRPQLLPRVAFMTGYSVEDEEFIAATGAPLLRKPFTATDVRRVVERVSAA